jgi:hypothetical protein
LTRCVRSLDATILLLSLTAITLLVPLGAVTEASRVIAFVASGHVAFFDAATREPVGCVRTEVGAPPPA